MLLSCSAMMEESTNKNSNTSLKKSSSNLKAVISNARYDVDNIHIYSNPSEFIGKIISTRGVYVEQKFLKDKDRKFIISGSNSGQAADYLVTLDHPLPKQSKIGENIQIISTNSGIRVFGKLKGIEDYLTETGLNKQLPVLEAIAIFNIDDREFQNPVWVNLLYN
jgi:hypothetical protein